jgi:hypothetical protein
MSTCAVGSDQNIAGHAQFISFTRQEAMNGSTRTSSCENLLLVARATFAINLGETLQYAKIGRIASRPQHSPMKSTLVPFIN